MKKPRAQFKGLEYGERRSGERLPAGSARSTLIGCDQIDWIARSFAHGCDA